MPQVNKCRCGHSFKPPSEGKWWWPDTDAPPGPEVRAVVRHGEHPLLRCIVRTGGGWVERGELRVRPWREVGLCWAGNCHPVVRTEAL